MAEKKEAIMRKNVTDTENAMIGRVDEQIVEVGKVI